MQIHGYPVTLPRHINGLSKFPLVQRDADTRPAGSVVSTTGDLVVIAGLVALGWWLARR